MSLHELPSFLKGLCWLLTCMASLSSAGRTPAVVDSGYVSALAAADHLMQAWQSGDAEQGMTLLTTHAKQTSTNDEVEKFFAKAEPAGYEITRGKMLKRGRYEFPVVVVELSANHRIRRRFSSIIVINTGNNDWAVDKLP